MAAYTLTLYIDCSSWEFTLQLSPVVQLALITVNRSKRGVILGLVSIGVQEEKSQLRLAVAADVILFKNIGWGRGDFT